MRCGPRGEGAAQVGVGRSGLREVQGTEAADHRLGHPRWEGMDGRIPLDER